jgi:ATP-dependent helicase YprA (DUF1998 family)
MGRWWTYLVLDEAHQYRGSRGIEMAMLIARLKQRLSQLNVLGGCCGTDHRHIEQIASTCSPLFRKTK